MSVMMNNIDYIYRLGIMSYAITSRVDVLSEQLDKIRKVGALLLQSQIKSDKIKFVLIDNGDTYYPDNMKDYVENILSENIQAIETILSELKALDIQTSLQYGSNTEVER